MKLPRIVWYRWANSERDFDALVIVGASNNQEAKYIAVERKQLSSALTNSCLFTEGVDYGAFLYVQFDDAHWDEEDGIPCVERWDVIVIGPEDQLFWQLVDGYYSDAQIDFEYIYRSHFPNLAKGQLHQALTDWCVANPDDARSFLEWSKQAWPRMDFHVNRIVNDPHLLALIEGAEIEGSTPKVVGADKECGHGKAL